MPFNLFLDAVIRMALKQHPDKGVQVVYTYNAPVMHNSRYKLNRSTLVQNLSYADDILLTSSNIEDLECLVTSLNNTCAKFGLKMNLKKTKFMSILPNNTTRLNITPTLQMSDDTNIERVSQFKYLGSILRSDNSVDAEVESCINRAAQVFRSISRLVWYQNKIKVSTKIKLFKSVIIPTLLYGSETWNLLTHHTQRLQVFVNKCLRIITRTFLWEEMRNTQLRNLTKIERVDVLIQKRRLQWLGHVERMSNERLQKKLGEQNNEW